MTESDVRWGIAATGGIAASFARAIPLVEGGGLVAVCSRSTEKAKRFAAEFAVPRAHGSYEALADDPEVDAVYIATPHSRHAADSILFLEAGKHVLCEKPFTLNTAQARRVFEVARLNDRFIMEAMWTRFLPSYERLAQVIADERIGQPLMVEADFGFRSEIDPDHRHFDLAQGGGALLDLGIYPLQLSTLVFGAPDRISAIGNVGVTGVDENRRSDTPSPGRRFVGAEGLDQDTYALHGPYCRDPRHHRDSGFHALSRAVHGQHASARRGGGSRLGRRGASLRDRGGPPLPGRRAHPEHPIPAARDSAVAGNPRRSPSPTRCRVPNGGPGDKMINPDEAGMASGR